MPCQEAAKNMFAFKQFADIILCMQDNLIQQLYEYFPTSVFTGKALVFISQDWRIELTSHKNSNFAGSTANSNIIRVRISQKALSGEYIPGHFEDFNIDNISYLAEQIERYVQFAVGSNIREQTDFTG